MNSNIWGYSLLHSTGARTCGFLAHSQEQKRQVGREDDAISISYPAEMPTVLAFAFALFFVLCSPPAPFFFYILSLLCENQTVGNYDPRVARLGGAGFRRCNNHK